VRQEVEEEGGEKREEKEKNDIEKKERKGREVDGYEEEKRDE
jgi:hypothetical protein